MVQTDQKSADIRKIESSGKKLESEEDYGTILVNKTKEKTNKVMSKKECKDSKQSIAVESSDDAERKATDEIIENTFEEVWPILNH